MGRNDESTLFFNASFSIFGLKIQVQQYLELGNQVSPENVA